MASVLEVTLRDGTVTQVKCDSFRVKDDVLVFSVGSAPVAGVPLSNLGYYRVLTEVAAHNDIQAASPPKAKKPRQRVSYLK